MLREKNKEFSLKLWLIHLHKTKHLLKKLNSISKDFFKKVKEYNHQES